MVMRIPDPQRPSFLPLVGQVAREALLYKNVTFSLKAIEIETSTEEMEESSLRS